MAATRQTSFVLLLAYAMFDYPIYVGLYGFVGIMSIGGGYEDMIV
jgi:hypothetical protein